MANISQSPIGANNDFFPFVTADSDRSVDWELKPQIFDSRLSKSFGPRSNCSLKIVLRMLLYQAQTNWGTDAYVRSIAASQRRNFDRKARYSYLRDSNAKYSIIKSWTPSEWDEFLVAFDTQASRWDRKFWLIPPPDFALFDVRSGSSTFRPNIECEFDIQYVTPNDNPHIRVQAANLHDPNRPFRSHMTLYDSADRHISERASMDPINGLFRDHLNHSTIAHEIGHAIGLPHIGVIRSRPNCELAIVLNGHLVLDSLGPMTAALLKGGSNSTACYGHVSAFDDAENVMGVGSKFAMENAAPWLERLPYHLRKPIDISKWKVSMTEILPAQVSASEVLPHSPGVGKKMQGSPKIGE